MLNKDEELRLAGCLSTIRAEISGKEEFALNLDTILWLAEKLKETNDELKSANCKCARTKGGTPPALHKCEKCGFEGSYDNVHYKCEGCNYIKIHKVS